MRRADGLFDIIHRLGSARGPPTAAAVAEQLETALAGGLAVGSVLCSDETSCNAVRSLYGEDGGGGCAESQCD